MKRIGILTGGGDCPRLNPVIRAVVKTAISKYGMTVVGFKNGYKRLYNSETIELTLENTSGILHKGGTILCSSNKDNLFDYLVPDENGNMVKRDVSHVGVENIKKNNIDAMIIIGGDGTLTSGRDFARLGVPVIGVPKTIDNDLSSTDTSPDPIRLGGIAQKVAEDLEQLVGLESHTTILGHIQRGGSPSSADRILSIRYGVAAVELAIEGKFGNMVSLKDNKMTYASLEDVIGCNKSVEPDGELVQIAKAIGVCFGD